MSAFENFQMAKRLTRVVQMATRGPYDRAQARKVIYELHALDKETNQNKMRDILGLVCHSLDKNMNMIPEAKGFTATLQEEFQFALARGELK